MGLPQIVKCKQMSGNFLPYNPSSVVQGRDQQSIDLKTRDTTMQADSEIYRWYMLLKKESLMQKSEKHKCGTKNYCNRLERGETEVVLDGIDMPTLETIETKGVSPSEYIRTIKLEKYRTIFERAVEAYTIKEDVVTKIAEIVKVKTFALRVFAADWCKDTRKAMSALSIIVNQIPEIDLEILGGIKNVPFDPNIRWKVPPSPPEVDTFDIRAIPTIIIFDKNGEEIGRMVENPEATETVEEEILYYLQMLPA